MNLAARLRAYVRLFATRPDLHVWHQTHGAPSNAPDLPPGDAGDLLGAHTLRFAWSFDPPNGDIPSSQDGGHLFLSADHEPWQSVDERWLDGAASSLLIDYVVEEGLGLLVIPEGGELADARPGFFDANDDRLIAFDDLEAYLTLGARRGFAMYWQNEEGFDWPDLLERLHEGSAEADLGDDALVEALRGRGASPEEARALVSWLGDDARILVPAG